MTKILWATTLALLLGATAHATPTRILTIDNGNLIVPDDWDATYYYSLSPNFQNHLYFDSYPSGKSFGWAFLDIKFGTLVLWFNKPFELGGLYDQAVANGASLGYSATDFGSGNAWGPKEKRLKAPDNKLAIGYALPLGDGLNLGLCFRLAQLDDKDEGENSGGLAPYGASGAALASLYPGLLVSKYSNEQASNGLLLSPQFSYFAEHFSLDAKFDLAWAGVDSKHSENVGNGSDSGIVTQTLKEKGTMNWAIKPRLRYMLGNDGSLVVRGEYGKQGFSTEHRVQGSFSNGGGLSGLQASGYDFADGSQDLGLTQWEAVAGLVKSWDKGKNLVVIGAKVEGATDTALNSSYQVNNAPSTYNDIVLKEKVDTTVNKLAVPVFMGAELGLAPWAKARGMVSRNFYTADDSSVTDETYASTGALSGRQVRKASDNIGADWQLAMGFGLNFGSFAWDTALNTGFLSSDNGAMVNPLYQSSFTYGF